MFSQLFFGEKMNISNKFCLLNNMLNLCHVIIISNIGLNNGGLINNIVIYFFTQFYIIQQGLII